MRGARLGFILIEERFFPKIPKFGNNRRYVSRYGGVQSLFVKFSRTKNIKFVDIPIFGKNPRKVWKIEKLREKNANFFGGKSSPIRMTLIEKRFSW